jgi:hypothetical protein
MLSRLIGPTPTAIRGAWPAAALAFLAFASVGCAQILGIDEPSSAAGDASLDAEIVDAGIVDAAIDVPDAIIDASVDAPPGQPDAASIDAALPDGGGGVIELYGGLTGIADEPTSAGSTHLVGTRIEGLHPVCSAGGTVCLIGGIAP